MGWAALFPGQGAQHAAMLPWLDGEPASQPALADMARLIGADWRQRLVDPDWRSGNGVAQALMTGTSLAAWSALAQAFEQGMDPPSAVAGYSVGELAAFSAAGVLQPAQALSLAARRARLMDAAVAGEATGLLSVSGLTAGQLGLVPAKGRDRAELHIAIDLAPTRLIVAGAHADLLAAERDWTLMGAETRRLDIHVASHSPFMASAATAFEATLATVDFAVPGSWVITNADGIATRQPARLRQALARQIDHTVLWQDSLQALAERQPRCVLEVGAGNALARMWQQAHPQIPVRSMEDFQHWRAAAAWVASHG